MLSKDWRRLFERQRQPPLRSVARRFRIHARQYEPGHVLAKCLRAEYRGKAEDHRHRQKCENASRHE